MRAQCESERQVEELFPASSTTAKVEEVEAGAGAGGGGGGCKLHFFPGPQFPPLERPAFKRAILPWITIVKKVWPTDAKSC